MTVPDLNSENSLTQQVMYSAAVDQFSSRNLAGRHIAVNPTSPAPHEVASFSLPFPGKSKLGTASENVTASGMNITYYPGVCVLVLVFVCACYFCNCPPLLYPYFLYTPSIHLSLGLSICLFLILLRMSSPLMLTTCPAHRSLDILTDVITSGYLYS